MSYYFKKNTAKSERKLFPKIILNDLRLFPIKIATLVEQQPFVEFANQIMANIEDSNSMRNRFLRRLSDNFQEIKITSALSTFDQLTFADFLKELKKQKIKLKLSEQDEWEEYFEDYRKACQELSAQITATNNEIDLHVYKLYGLTYDEVLIVDPETAIKREEYE